MKVLRPTISLLDTTWFEYVHFSAISSLFPRTPGKTEAFHTGMDKLAGLWKKDRVAET